MNSPIQDMRDRLTERLSGTVKPNKGYKLTGFRPTANDMPRLPQSSIPSPKQSYDRVGRPSKGTKPEPQLFRKKPRDIWGGWL